MPYSLVDQRPLHDELAWCLDRGIGIIKGAPYASGILAADTARAGDRAASTAATYDYRAPSAEVRSTVSRIAAVCERHGVPMRAAALQFLLAHPAVAAVIPGAATSAEVADNARMLSVSIPADLWRELRHERLLQDGAPTPRLTGIGSVDRPGRRCKLAARNHRARSQGCSRARPGVTRSTWRRTPISNT